MLNVLGEGEWANEQHLFRVFSLVDVHMRLLLIGAVTCRVLHNSPTCFWDSQSDWADSRLWAKKSSLASNVACCFQGNIYVCWFHLCGFAGNWCDGKEGSAGISRGRRSLKASLKWWIDLQINLGISRSFKPGVSGCIGFGNWMRNSIVSSSGSSMCLLPGFCISQCGNNAIKITPFPSRRYCFFTYWSQVVSWLLKIWKQKMLSDLFRSCSSSISKGIFGPSVHAFILGASDPVPAFCCLACFPCFQAAAHSWQLQAQKRAFDVWWDAGRACFAGIGPGVSPAGKCSLQDALFFFCN